MIQLAALLVSLIPSAAVFFWLMNGLRQGDGHNKNCGKLFLRGFLAPFPIFFLGLLFSILWKLSELESKIPMGHDLFHALILTSGVEEFVKYTLLNKTLREEQYSVSWLQVIAWQTIIALAFGVSEDLVYAFSTNVGQIIVRGIAMGHVSYGFLMGYFRGKGMKTGNGFYRILACVLPWAMHALYNFSLSPVVAGNDFFTFTAVTLAALDVIIWVFFVLKLRKWRDSIEFTLPLWDLQ